MEFTMYLQRMLDNEIPTYEEVDPKRVILIPRQYSQEESLFDDDLKNLKAHFPNLGIALLNKTPYKIEMSLAEISQVCPRNRQRIDSYNRLKRFISDYEAKNRSSLTFILAEHLNPYSASPSTFLSESKIKGSQNYNGFADQTILVGKTRVNGCVRVKIAKNRYGEEQVYTVHLFQKVDEVFFQNIGEYDEKQVLLPKNGNSMSLDEFRKVVKPTSTPTFKKKNNVAGRPINLTLSICKAILYARSQGQSKNAASRAEGFTRQAYNEALKRYGLVDDYPDGNWKP